MSKTITKENLYYTKEEIFDIFNSFPEIEDKSLSSVLVHSLAILPSKLIDKIAENIVFICCCKSIYGIFINYKTVRYRNKDLVILNAHKILKFSLIKQRHIILHEVAHYVLQHKNFDDYESEGQYEINEKLADLKVKEWITNFDNKKASE